VKPFVAVFLRSANTMEIGKRKSGSWLTSPRHAPYRTLEFRCDMCYGNIYKHETANLRSKPQTSQFRSVDNYRFPYENKQLFVLIKY